MGSPNHGAKTLKEILEFNERQIRAIELNNLEACNSNSLEDFVKEVADQKRRMRETPSSNGKTNKRVKNRFQKSVTELKKEKMMLEKEILVEN